MDAPALEPPDDPVELAAAVGQLVTVTELGRRGMGPNDVRRAVADGRMVRARRSVYVPRDAYDQVARWDRATVAVHAHSLAAVNEPLYCQESAARIWQLDLHGVGTAIHVARPGRRGRDKGRPVVVNHKIAYPSGDLVRARGLHVTSLERTVVDCARLMDVESGVVLVDSALRRGVPRERLHSALADLGTARGIRRAQFVLGFADGRSESAAESRTRVLLNQWGFPAPALQYEFNTRAGRYRADFAWPEFGLVIEVHGDGKYFMEQSMEMKLLRERKREAALNEQGIRVLNLWWKDLDSAGLRERIAQHLRPALRAA